MTKYYAVVRFETLEFEADTEEHANEIVNELIEDFSGVDTNIGWDNVDWTLYQEEE